MGLGGVMMNCVSRVPALVGVNNSVCAGGTDVVTVVVFSSCIGLTGTSNKSRRGRTACRRAGGVKISRKKLLADFRGTTAAGALVAWPIARS